MVKRERKANAFIRFSLSGTVFTVLGPALFWFFYPIGPYFAVAATETIVHTMRFFTFRYLVFPRRKGYQVNAIRYFYSSMPVTLSSFVCIGLLKDSLDRTTLTLYAALASLIIGFLWSRFIYSQDSK
jgi:hypothetical protein